MWLELTGDAYWEISDDNEMIWIVPSKQMEPIPDPKTGIKGYRFTDYMGVEKEVSPDKIIHFQYRSPLDLYFGTASLDPIWDIVQADLDFIKLNTNMVKNMGMFGGTITWKEHPGAAFNQKLINRIRRQYIQKFYGPEKAYVPIILHPNMQYTESRVATRDIQLREWGKEIGDRIQVAFRVPKVALGVFLESQGALSTNAEQQMQFFYRDTLKPKLNKIINVSNNFYIPRFNTGKSEKKSNYKLRWQYEEVPYLRNQQQKLSGM